MQFGELLCPFFAVIRTVEKIRKKKGRDKEGPEPQAEEKELSAGGRRTEQRQTHTPLQEGTRDWISTGEKGKLFSVSTINCSPGYTKAYSRAYYSNKISKTVSCTLRAIDYKYTGKNKTKHAACSLTGSICSQSGSKELTKQFINNSTESLW